MRKIYVFLLLAISTFSGISGNWTEISSPSATPAGIRLVSSTIDRSLVQITLGGFSMNEVQTPGGQAFSIEIGKATPILEAGAPDLPKIAVSLVIPDQAGMEVRVVSSLYKDYQDILIAPSKGVIMRDVDPATVPFQYGAAYARNEFYPGMMTGARDPYIIRDVRGQTVMAFPFQYNPVTKVLRVYYEMTIELYKTSDTGINPLVAGNGPKKIHPDFRSVMSRQFMNFDAVNYTTLEEYGNLLVIAHGPFMAAMQPFVDWKRAEGYQTEIISKDSVGTSAAQIKSFIANYYTTKGLTHVLLVGDAPQVPTNTGGGLGGPSDNAYGYITGNDHYPEVFIGRFSAENEAQVQTQVLRTLDYEQNPQFLTDDWYTTVIGIASDQGPGDDGEMDYQHIRNQQAQLFDYTYTDNPELFDGSQGGNDANGNPSPPMVATAVNAGASLILYTGHGSKTSWGSSGFSNNNVNQLTNAGMLPFVWSVACVNGEFMSGGPCFAEAWMRASQGGQPTGAIAFLASTINQSWNSPMEGQDEMTNILSETDSTNIKRTFAGISINGCMKMIDSYGMDGQNMADTWTVFGDPTIMVRSAVPTPLTAQYDTMLFVTDSVLVVYCPVNGARITATVGDNILATSVVTNDTVILTFPPLDNPFDTLHIVATAYNMIPFIGEIVIRDIPVPVVAGFTGLPNRVVPGHTVAFADTSVGMTTTWNWHFPGGTPETSTEKNPVITYETLGVYDVTLVVGDGFTTDSITGAGYIVVDFPTSAGSAVRNLHCTVLPNPSQGTFLLKLESLPSELLDIKVFDMLGNQVFAEPGIESAGSLTRTLDLNAQPEGIYFLKLSGKQGVITRKLVINR